MHSTIRRFYSLVDTLAAIDGPATADPRDRALRAEYAGDQHILEQIRAAQHEAETPDAIQTTLVFYAARAALADLEQDITLGPILQTARERALARGQSESAFRRLAALALYEEALDPPGPVDAFDGAYVAETLASIGSASDVSPERLEAVYAEFIESADSPHRSAYENATAALGLDWSLGERPIHFDHLRRTVDDVIDQETDEDLPDVAAAVDALLGYLARCGVIGPLRAERLRGEAARRFESR